VLQMVVFCLATTGSLRERGLDLESSLLLGRDELLESMECIFGLRLGNLVGEDALEIRESFEEEELSVVGNLDRQYLVDCSLATEGEQPKR
jgi:hypothetical protein